jgi:hypothetical protein
MALKRRISAEDYAKLAAHFQGEYIKKGDDYFLDAEENDDYRELKTARDNEKAAAKEAKRLAKEAQDKIDEMTAEMEDLRTNAEGKTRTESEKLVAAHQREIAKLQKQFDERFNGVNGQLNTLLIDNVADQMANDLFKFTPDIFANSIIKPRLKIVEKDGKAMTVAVDSEGAEMDVSKLREELVANSKFSDILKPVNKASGGGATAGLGGGNGGGGAKTLTEQHAEQARAQGLIK